MEDRFFLTLKALAKPLRTSLGDIKVTFLPISIALALAMVKWTRQQKSSITKKKTSQMVLEGLSMIRPKDN